MIDCQDIGLAPHAAHGLEDAGSGTSRAAEHISYSQGFHAKPQP
jgi:hypothetical protein